MKCKLLVVATALCFFHLATCNAQTITVRVIDAGNGKPLRGQRVSLSLNFHNDLSGNPSAPRWIEFTTNDKGEAQYTLPQPAPINVGAISRLNPEHWSCGCNAGGATEDVVRSGQMAKPGEAEYKEPSGIKPVAGEILLWGRHRPLWQRIFIPWMFD